jgi:hypothetical protein
MKEILEAPLNATFPPPDLGFLFLSEAPENFHW